MRVLALDTATRYTAVALLDGDRLVGEAVEPSSNHSRTLLPAIEGLFSRVSLGPADLEAVAVGIGPGSFTGVRVGLTVAKSLAFALRIPVAGVSTLRALAGTDSGAGPELVSPVIDALKGEIYAAVFDRTRGFEALDADAARNPQAWATRLEELGRRCLMIGSGALRYREIFERAMGDSCTIPGLDDDRHLLRAESVGRLAMARLSAGDSDDPHDLQPSYCRLSEAELARREAGG